MSKNNNTQNQNPNPIFIMAPPQPPPQPQDNGIFGGLGGIVCSVLAGLVLSQLGVPHLPGNIKF